MSNAEMLAAVGMSEAGRGLAQEAKALIPWAVVYPMGTLVLTQQRRKTVFINDIRFPFFRNDGSMRVWRQLDQEFLKECRQMHESHAISLHEWDIIAYTPKNTRLYGLDTTLLK